MQEITSAADSLRQQTTQAGRAMEEQATGVRRITMGIESVTKQIKLITNANQQHSASASAILDRVFQVQQLSGTNATDAAAIQRRLELNGGSTKAARPISAKLAGKRKTGRQSFPAKAAKAGSR